MKNFTKLFAILFAATILFQACQTKPETKEPTIGVFAEGDCRITKMTFNYEETTKDISFAYNDNNKVISIDRRVNEYKGRHIKMMYGADGNISKLEVYQEDTLTLYETITWKNELAIVSLFGLENDEWVNKNKIALTYNDMGNIILLDDYTADSSDVWALKGTLYDFKWENGNISNISNYIVVEDSLLSEPHHKKNETFLLVNIDDEAYIVDTYSDLELFYTASYEYYDAPNPLHHLSIAKIIAPNEFNCSENIPKKITKTYASGEIIVYNYEYTSNEKGYPVELNAKIVYTGFGETINETFKVNLEYDNCK